MMWKECGRVRSSYGRPSIQREGDLLSRYTAGQMNAVASGIIGAHDLSVALRSLATYLCLSLLFLCVSVLSLPSQSLPPCSLPCISSMYLPVSALLLPSLEFLGGNSLTLTQSWPRLIPISALITLTGCPDCPAFILYLYHYSHCLCLLSLPIVPPLARLCLFLSPRLSIYVTKPCLMILPLNSAFHTSLPHSLPSFLPSLPANTSRALSSTAARPVGVSSRSPAVAFRNTEVTALLSAGTNRAAWSRSPASASSTESRLFTYADNPGLSFRRVSSRMVPRALPGVHAWT